MLYLILPTYFKVIIIKTKMYEHPIKRAGLSLNSIIYSNTKMVMHGFPGLDQQKFNLAFKYRTFENGKVASVKCKSARKSLTPLTILM